MKNITFTILASLTFTVSYAQQVSYEVIENDPSKVRGKFIALEFMNADIGGNSNANTIAVGANAIWGLSQKIGLEGRFNYAVAKPEELGACIQFQAGIALNMTSSEKTKNIKVRFDGKADVVENEHVQKEKYILVPGNNLNSHGVRGGIYLYKKGYKDQGIDGKPEIPYFLGGVYAGWGLTQRTNLVVKLTKATDGTKLPDKPLYYRGYTRYYIDGIITPIATRQFPFAGMEAASSVKNKLFGVRGGVQFYKDGPKWYNKFMWGVETGLRPIDGFYFNVSVGYSLYRGQ